MTDEDRKHPRSLPIAVAEWAPLNELLGDFLYRTVLRALHTLLISHFSITSLAWTALYNSFI
jgi:hypothetical protein